MEHDRFDSLTKALVTRRSGLGLALVALLGFAVADANAKKKKPKPKKCKPNCAVCKACNKGKCKPNGTGCGGGKICAGHLCKPAMPPPPSCPGATPCGADCVDLTANPNHCGRCGNACPPGITCQGGAAALRAPPATRRPARCVSGRCACDGPACVCRQAACGGPFAICSATPNCCNGGCQSNTCV